MNYIDIITRLKRKDPEALEEIIRKYHSYVAGIVMSVLEGCSDILDMQAVINNIFFSLWENAEKIDVQNYFDLKPYLGAVARNISLNEKKRIFSNRTLPFDEHLFITVKDDFSEIEMRELLLFTLRELRQEYQIVLIKFYFQGKTIKQIAEEEKQSESTIKTWLKRGREKLGILLTEGGFVYEN